MYIIELKGRVVEVSIFARMERRKVGLEQHDISGLGAKPKKNRPVSPPRKKSSIGTMHQAYI